MASSCRGSMGGALSEITQPCCTGECNDAATERNVEVSNEPPPGAYVVTLDRAIDTKLGIDVEQRKDGKKLPIRGITGGLAEKWNKSHPSTLIKQGDAIIEVNGVRDDIASMMQRCRSDQVLKMIIMRADGLAPSGAQPPPVITSPAGSDAASSSGPANPPLAPPPPADDAAAGPQAGGVSGDADPAALARMTELGIPERKAREALSMSGGDVDMAIRMAANVDKSSVDSLIGMGFTEAASREALIRSGGNVDVAVASLTGAATDGDDTPARGGAVGGNPGGGQGANTASVAHLIAMGFTEQQAREALLSSGGDMEQAVIFLSSSGGQAASGGDPPGVADIIAMGFTREQAINALDGSGGNVERAVNFLMG